MSSLRCSGSAGGGNCEYCGKPVIISNFSTAAALANADIGKYTSYYTKILSSDPGNRDVNVALAFCYMRLKLYDKATEAFDKAMDNNLDNPDVFFSAAVALLKGKRAYFAPRAAIDKCMEYINAAMTISPKGIYQYFLAYIKYDYFFKHYLKPPQPDWEEDMEAAYTDYDVSEKEIRELFKFLRIQRPESMERKSRETGNEPVSQPARDNIFKQIGDMVSKIWGRMKVWHIILFTTLVILALWAVFFFKNVKETIDYVDEIESTDGPTQVSDPNTDRQTIVTDVVYDWNQCHSRKDAKAMARLFAPKVKYYQETYTPERIAAHKQGLFDKYPEFRQGVSNLEYTALSDNKIKVHFDKKVWTSADGKATVYPSYLVVEKIGDKWLISEESDDITDRNLARKRQE